VLKGTLGVGAKIGRKIEGGQTVLVSAAIVTVPTDIPAGARFLVRQPLWCDIWRRRTRRELCEGATATHLPTARGLCPRHRQKSRSKDCGGSVLCQHQRRKNLCKDCGGLSLCQHQRRKSLCKDCGGLLPCPRHRQKSRCRDCGGLLFCPHQRRKGLCKDCKE